jgi:hypothetical protein
MSALRHPNCTLYLGACLEPPCLLMEYCSRKSVDCILKAAHTDAKVVLLGPGGSPTCAGPEPGAWALRVGGGAGASTHSWHPLCCGGACAGVACRLVGLRWCCARGAAGRHGSSRGSRSIGRVQPATVSGCCTCLA